MGAYLSATLFGMGAYSRGGLIRGWMLNLLLMDTNDNDSGYLAHLLFDLLKSDAQAQTPKISNLI